MGWAWLVVHDKTESDAWRFDEESRDKGGDWVPAPRASGTLLRRFCWKTILRLSQTIALLWSGWQR
ncbi:MAG: hypothetical protein Ct9H90mP1_0670 [Methanobacteriota archaeon]|nr:MAG: hypothetical protein Ct9H90mP1_0670 [Euryarchaeota archaeon]